MKKNPFLGANLKETLIRNKSGILNINAIENDNKIF